MRPDQTRSPLIDVAERGNARMKTRGRGRAGDVQSVKATLGVKIRVVSLKRSVTTTIHHYGSAAYASKSSRDSVVVQRPLAANEFQPQSINPSHHSSTPRSLHSLGIRVIRQSPEIKLSSVKV